LRNACENGGFIEEREPIAVMDKPDWLTGLIVFINHRAIVMPANSWRSGHPQTTSMI
jgi:hypothetical protein